MISRKKNKQSLPVGKKVHRWYFYLGLTLLGILLAVVLLAGGFLLFLTVTEYDPAPVEEALQGGAAECPELSGNTLRVLSFNTGYASLGWEADFLMDGGQGSGLAPRETVEENMAGIRQILETYPADVYMLQEVDLDSARTFGMDFLDYYGQALPDCGWAYAPNYRCKFVPYPLPTPFGAMDSGVATYSPWQTTEALRHSLPVPFDWPVRTANLKRCMLLTRFPLKDREQELVVINFHLEAYDSGEGKQAQTDQLLTLIREEYGKGNYVIAGGDFNQMFPDVDTVVKPSSEWVPGRLEELPEDMAGWQYAYDDSVPTCRLLNQPNDPEDPLTQYYVIDGFILSPNLTLQSIETVDRGFFYSDHNPVVMELKLS